MVVPLMFQAKYWAIYLLVGIVAFLVGLAC